MRRLPIIFVLVFLVCLTCAPEVEHPNTAEAPKQKKWKLPALPGWLENIKEGKWPWKKRGDREFVRGTGINLPLAAGETVVSAIIPNGKALFRPFLWMYAVDEDNVVSFFPGPTEVTKGLARARVINIRDTFAHIKLQNRRRKKNHVGIVGSLVAALMVESKATLPFHLLRCNGKHYVEYLSVGGGKGSYLSIMHFRRNSKCPVRAPLMENMAEMIFKSGKFTLESKVDAPIKLALPGVDALRKGEHAYRLWPEYIKNMNLFNWQGTQTT